MPISIQIILPHTTGNLVPWADAARFERTGYFFNKFLLFINFSFMNFEQNRPAKIQCQHLTLNFAIGNQPIGQESYLILIYLFCFFLKRKERATLIANLFQLADVHTYTTSRTPCFTRAQVGPHNLPRIVTRFHAF